MSSSQHSDNSVSLFPFLAVLICTMGALSVLLLVTTNRIRQDRTAKAEAELIAEHELARENARADAQPRLLAEPPQQAAPIPRIPAPVIDRHAALERRVAELVKRRDLQRRQSGEEEATLHSAKEKLEASAQQLSRTQRELEEVRAAKTAHVQEREKFKAERSSLSGRISEAEQQLRKQRETKQHAVTKYAFVPYDGSSGTIRRPILIECTEHGLRFLQEDVTLTASDLDGFTVSFNPLAAGAAALIEYWQRRATGPNEPEPYVLLVVRPSGSGAYYAARKLLSRLTQPWGYELMAEDEKLDIPPEDLKASEALRTAISQCRRQKDNRLRAMRGGNGPPGDSAVHFQSDHGDNGGRGGGSGVGGSAVGGPAGIGGNGGPAGHGVAGGDAAGGTGISGGGAGDRSRIGSVVPSASGSAAGAAARPGSGFAFTDEEAPFIDGPNGSARRNGARTSTAGASENGEGSGQGEATPGSTASGSGKRLNVVGAPGPKTVNGATPGSRNASTTPGSPNGNRAAAAKNGTVAGEGTPREPGPFDSLREEAGPADRQPVASGLPGPNRPQGRRGSGTQEQAERPANAPPQTLEPFDIDRQFGSPDSEDPRKRWGLINRRATIGFTRKITVQVTEREVFVGDEAPIPVGNGETAEQLARALRQNIEVCTHGWGFPPQNFYWVPSLQFVVYPGGDSHYERMKEAARVWELSTSVKHKQADVEPAKGQN